MMRLRKVESLVKSKDKIKGKKRKVLLITKCD